MDDNANEQAAAAEQEEEQEAAHHHMDRDKQEQEQQWRRPPPPPPFLRSAHPSFSPLPSPRQSPPRPASPSALQPIAEVNARRTAQLLRDAARDQELERARRAPLLIEGASQSSPPGVVASDPLSGLLAVMFSSSHSSLHTQRPAPLPSPRRTPPGPASARATTRGRRRWKTDSPRCVRTHRFAYPGPYILKCTIQTHDRRPAGCCIRRR